MSDFKFWSVWYDYFATGEGRTIGLMYCRSTDREGAIRQAKRHFHEYFMQGAEAEPGIKTDGVFKLLAPPYVAEKFLKMEDGSEPEGHAEWYGNFHVNYS